MPRLLVPVECGSGTKELVYLGRQRDQWLSILPSCAPCLSWMSSVFRVAPCFAGSSSVPSPCLDFQSTKSPISSEFELRSLLLVGSRCPRNSRKSTNARSVILGFTSSCSCEPELMVQSNLLAKAEFDTKERALGGVAVACILSVGCGLAGGPTSPVRLRTICGNGCGPSIFDVCVCVGLWWSCSQLVLMKCISWWSTLDDFWALFATALAQFLTEVAVLTSQSKRWKSVDNEYGRSTFYSKELDSVRDSRPPGARGGIQMLGTGTRPTAWPRSVRRVCLRLG